MRVLVTGATGYLGAACAITLQQEGHEVVLLSRRAHAADGLVIRGRATTIQGDLTERQIVQRIVKGVDSIVHLAGLIGADKCVRMPELAFATNIEATSILLDEAAAVGVRRVVVASSCSVYGRNATDSYVDERALLAPISRYGCMKLHMEHLAERMAPRLECVTLRFATMFGWSERMRFDFAVNRLVLDLITTRAAEVVGATFWRPYLHVIDAADAIGRVLRASSSAVAGEVFNVGATDYNYRAQDVAERAVCLLGLERNVLKYEADATDRRDYRVSCEKIASRLGFCPTRTLDTGIMELKTNLAGTTSGS